MEKRHGSVSMPEYAKIQIQSTLTLKHHFVVRSLDDAVRSIVGNDQARRH
jgi:hypothetical protein